VKQPLQQSLYRRVTRRLMPSWKQRPVRQCAAAAAATTTALMLAGCATAPVTPPEQLQGTAWKVVALGDTTVADAGRSTLRFFDRQLAGGSLGCNAYSTTYFADASGLRFGAIAPTREVCAAPLMDQEARFARALQDTRGLRVTETGTLLLLDEAGRTRATLGAMKPQ
jgi:heat shock protein HslJ